MKKIKLLVLTDHSGHSKENSLYELMLEMYKHPACDFIDVCSRGNKENSTFFQGNSATNIFVTRVNNEFAYSASGDSFKALSKTDINQYDAILLRLPPNNVDHFFAFLNQNFSDKVIINNPSGIVKTGSKEFLVNFPEITPPIMICKNIEDIRAFKAQFPIVLKPFRNYGGHGLVRIDNDKVYADNKIVSYDDWEKQYLTFSIPYLGVKFLKNVSEGDKRIVVVNGQIIGASLRLPSEGSWLCNAAQGGTSGITDITKEEEHIVKVINPILSQYGIVMYGVDTLVNDEGKRILSEINTTSIGGLRQMQELYNQPILEMTSNGLWDGLINKLESKI